MDYTLGIYQSIGKEELTFYWPQAHPCYTTRIQGISRLLDCARALGKVIPSSGRADEVGNTEVCETASRMDPEQAPPRCECCQCPKSRRRWRAGCPNVLARRHWFVELTIRHGVTLTVILDMQS